MVVVRVCPDPKPDGLTKLNKSDGAIRHADTSRIDWFFRIDALEVQPRMKRVLLELPKCRLRLLLNAFR